MIFDIRSAKGRVAVAVATAACNKEPSCTHFVHIPSSNYYYLKSGSVVTGPEPILIGTYLIVIAMIKIVKPVM